MHLGQLATTTKMCSDAVVSKACVRHKSHFSYLYSLFFFSFPLHFRRERTLENALKKEKERGEKKNLLLGFFFFRSVFLFFFLPIGLGRFRRESRPLLQTDADIRRRTIERLTDRQKTGKATFFFPFFSTLQSGRLETKKKRPWYVGMV